MTKKKDLVQTKSDFWSNLKVWQQHSVLLFLLFLLPLFLHNPLFFGGKTLVTHDIIQWRAGAESLQQYYNEFEEQPHWATNMFSGMPGYVISNVKRFPHFDTIIQPIFKSIFPLTEYWILLSGSYFFLLLMGYRPLVSALGAIFIAFTTYIPIIVGAGHNTKFIAYTWIPWLFAGYKLLSSRPKYVLAGFALFIFAFLMHIRAGHPQVTYYFLFLLAIWWISDGIEAWKAGKLKNYSTTTGLLLVAGFLTIFGIIEQYWSVYEYSSYSIRGGSELVGSSGLSQNYAFVWSQGWGELLTLLIPGLYGGSELYWGPKPMTSGPHYFGAIATLGLIIGLFVARKAHLKVFLTTAILAILFALGKHLPALNETMFDYFPFFNKFRTPEMWLILAVFCLTIPAMDGFEWIAEKAGKISSIGNLWKYALGIATFIGLIFVIGGSNVLSFQKDGEREAIASQIASRNQVSPQDPRVTQTVNQIIREQIIPGREEKARADAIRYTILVVFASGILWALLAGKIGLGTGFLILFVVSAYDMIQVGKQYIPDHVYQANQVSIERSIESQKRPADTFMQNAIKTEEPWTYRVFPLADNPFNNAIPSYFYPSIGGYTGAKMSIYQDVLDEALFAGPMGINMAVLNMLNVRFMTYGSQIPGFSVAFRDEQVLVLENENVLPKAFFVESLIYANSATEALDAIINAIDDGHNIAVVEHAPNLTASADSLAQIEITRYDAHHIDIQIERSTDGFLVLSEIYYPSGWYAYLNGEEIPIHKTNYILRGMEIPAGVHTLEMRHTPDWYPIARNISNVNNILILLLITVSGWFTWKRRKEDLTP